MPDPFSSYFGLLLESSRDRDLRTGLRRTIASYRRNLDEILARYPGTRDLCGEVRRIKEEAAAELGELVRATADSIEESGGRAYVARDAREAREIIGKIVGSGKLVVKSKSLTSEEVELNPYLESLGNEVVETDLGEFIVQLAGTKPMHLVIPALHVPRERVAELFAEKLGVRTRAEVGDLVRVAREYLREKYFEADVGN